jgi:hypothetical protein
MKKILLVFVYLSYFILGNSDPLIREELPKKYGVFTTLVKTVLKYKKLQETLNAIENNPSHNAIQRSLDNLISDLIKFYDFHQKSFPIAYTKDINQPFDIFNKIILLNVKKLILDLDGLNEDLISVSIPNINRVISLINKNIDSINDAFIDTLLDILLLKPIDVSTYIYKSKDLSPTHLYALILFYRQTDVYINSLITTDISEVAEYFNSLRQSLFSAPATQSLDLFQSFLEEKDYAPGYTFKDYVQTHKLNDVDYSEQLLEAFASAEKI